MESLLKITLQQWLLLFIGFSLPLIVKFFQLLISYLLRRKSLSPFIKTWHIYHWSRDDYKPVFREEKWRIKRGFWSPLIITTLDSKRKDLKYKGQIRLEAGQVAIDMAAVGHREESWYARIQSEPIPSEDERGCIFRGLLLDQDFDRKIYCGVFIGVTKEMSEDEAKSAIRRIAKLKPEESCLRLLEKPIFEDQLPSEASSKFKQ